MGARVIRFLSFLRLVDAHDGSVSLTNTVLWVAIVKLALVREASVVDLASLMTAMLAYAHKRAGRAKIEVPVAGDSPPIFDGAPLQAGIAALQAKMKDLEAFVGSVKLGMSNVGRR